MPVVLDNLSIIMYTVAMNTLNTNILTVRQNNKLVLSNMLRQYCSRLVWAVLEGWDAFLVKSGRVKAQESLE